MLNKKDVVLISIITIVLLSSSLFSTELAKTRVPLETYFKFSISSKEELKSLTKIISIDNVVGSEVYAYANQNELQKLKELGHDIEVLPHPSTLIIPKMAKSKEQMKNWDYYPTYDAYVDMMYQFQSDYPDLCIVENIGYSVEGREILFARISDNVHIEEDEPEFMYTATMHGDETTGYVLMLRLIDYLLSNYGTDNEVSNVVDNIEIWINPLANPDGTYRSGNHTVYGATRYNANGVDLNRNFPDPEDGPHPDGNTWQPETIALMDIAEAHTFVHSANFHGGAEVVNYPWDTREKLHADDEWYQVISHAYADTVHANSPSSYMDGFNDGITNGYQWYTIAGGRQDYMNYWNGCKETTIELSNTKLLPVSQLPAHWNYNKQSFLNYIENVLYGIRGIVTDSLNNPIDAMITVVGYDFDNSEVFTDPDVGDYHRMLLPGTYDIMISSDGYIPQTITSIAVTDGPATIVNVELEPELVTVSGVSIAPSGVSPGDREVGMLKFSLVTNSGEATWTYIKVDLTGTAVVSDISSVEIWKDDGDGIWEGTGQDIVIGLGTFNSNTETIAIADQTVTTTSQDYFIVYDIASEAEPSHTAKAKLADNSYITVTSPSIVSSANFPIQSGEVTLPVELSAFSATYVAELGYVSICWATSSEADVIGFNIYRSEYDDITAGNPINVSLIPGQNTTSETSEYSFTDETADPYFTTYYYWLEVIDNGGFTNVHGSFKYTPIDVNNNGELDMLLSNFNSCYPNPARIGNEIQFNFQVGGLKGTSRHVELKVYNILGKLIVDIVNEERLVNNYCETWKPIDISTGVYFFQFNTKNYNTVKKMLLIR